MLKPLLGAALAAALAAPAPPPAGLDARPGTYTIDPVHSSVLFRIKHLEVAFVYGRFNEISGSVTLDPEAPEESTIAFEIPVAGVDTNNQQRDDHLRSADFFDVENHPTIKFRSESIRVRTDGKLEVEGKLLMHGELKDVTAEAEFTGAGPDLWGGYRAGFEASLLLDRTAFGITTYADPVSPPGSDASFTPLAHQVLIRVSLETVLES